jgi:hypothetical protein
VRGWASKCNTTAAESLDKRMRVTSVETRRRVDDVRLNALIIGMFAAAGGVDRCPERLENPPTAPQLGAVLFGGRSS